MPQTRFSFGDPAPLSDLPARIAPAHAAHFDELRDADGRLHAHWQQFFDSTGIDDLAELDRRRGAVDRQVHDDGITYNVYADGDGESARPWPLDLLPFIISAADWAQIERGVAQRAALLSQVLHDIYGPQTLLAEGLLPPALVFGHPGYLRPLVGSRPVGGTCLQVLAFDLARAPDGRWWVVSQRTQAPSGLGYALQNRLIISRQFPEAFRALRVQRLAGGFRRLLDTLTHAAPRGNGERDGGGAPRIALLTPGPYNETYFEHAYLARYLGLPLVEGSDLTVRDDAVYLKTVHGLERVHALLRRLDDDWCDPLELRADSALGVPGLLQAVRAGKVLVANALGAGFLESPALQGFLPALSNRLLNEPLALPSLASWWCGEQAAWEAVSPRLQDKVIKPTYPPAHGRRAAEAVIGADLSAAALAGLRALIDADPAAYTVQEYLPLSQARVWQDGLLLPRAAMVRVFAIADGAGRWQALPGGLTRIAGRAQRVVSMQSGGSSLDTWVQTEGAVDRSTLLRASLTPEDLARQRRPVTSRAAENLFWMGRYAERADHSARLAQAVLTLLTDDGAPAPAVAQALGRLCTQHGLVPPNTPTPLQSEAVFERTLLAGLRDPAGSSVAFNLAAMRRAGSQIRERLSAEHWQLLSVAIDRFAPGAQREAKRAAPAVAGALSAPQALGALRRLSVNLAAIGGAQADRMTRDDGWRLLTSGRQIERLACLTAALLTLEETHALHDEAGFDLLLQLADSTVTYRALYQGRHELPPLLHLLVHDGANPRSLACVAELLRAELARLPAPSSGLATLLPPVRDWPSLALLCAADVDGRLPALSELARRLRGAALALSDTVGVRYFSHADGYQVLG